MRHQKVTIKLNRSKGHMRALLANMAAQLIIFEDITTTEAKAKALRTVVEPLVTKAKTDSLHNRRQALAFLPMKKAVQKLYEVIGPRYKERPGGYLRIIKLGRRAGDAAAMAKIQFVK
ncbi:MAG: 50S ribosomal protein L17 [Candidatus Komeilibacteria bacterium]